jgi:hypothetical protein
MVLLQQLSVVHVLLDVEGVEAERSYQDTSYDLHHRDANLAHYPYYVDLEAT